MLKWSEVRHKVTDDVCVIWIGMCRISFNVSILRPTAAYVSSVLRSGCSDTIAVNIIYERRRHRVQALRSQLSQAECDLMSSISRGGVNTTTLRKYKGSEAYVTAGGKTFSLRVGWLTSMLPALHKRSYESVRVPSIVCNYKGVARTPNA